MSRLAVILAALLLALAAGPALAAEPAPIHVIELHGEIDRVAADFVRDEIADSPYLAVVELDSGGGQQDEAQRLADAIDDGAAALWVRRAEGAALDLAASVAAVGARPGVEGVVLLDRFRTRSVEAYIAALDGQRVGDEVVRTRGHPIERESLAWHQRLRQSLASANLVFLLLLVGFAGLAVETLHPGGILSGLTGLLGLAGAVIGLSGLDFSWAGLALTGAGLGLLGVEPLARTRGTLAGVGVLAAIGGGLWLFWDSGGGRASAWVVVLGALALWAGFTAISKVVLRARRSPPATGGGALVGEPGTARTAIGREPGRVLVNGEIWWARAQGSATIPAGAGVRVVTVHSDDLTLTVAPREE